MVVASCEVDVESFEDISTPQNGPSMEQVLAVGQVKGSLVAQAAVVPPTVDGGGVAAGVEVEGVGVVLPACHNGREAYRDFRVWRGPQTKWELAQAPRVHSARMDVV